MSDTILTMKGRAPVFLYINKLAQEMLIIIKCHRTLDIAKTVSKERSYVYSKTDQIIHLSKDGKLEEVSCLLLILMLRAFLL